MAVLKPITDCDEDTYSSIVGAKRGARKKRLENIWAIIEKRYGEYESCADKLESLSTLSLSKVRSNDLRHCFESPTKPLNSLIERLLKIAPENGSIVCQYCLFGEIDCVDHYLPKNKFPEFSVLPRNLVPACSRCNRMKGSKWLHNGDRAIVSLYFDDVPNEQFIEVDISFPRGNRAKVEFRLTKPAGMQRVVFRRLQQQFDTLNLIERYNLFGAEFVSEVVAVAHSKRRARVESNLESSAAGLATQFGRNYYKSLVYRSLASNDEFMTLINAT
ncbi:HNH endonuclease [Novipirellula rosea]|uniref:HNH domain-containing protein n=1 Tax=Novipirellula rosea TaxID=1031540 RepID=A0ABP8MLL9_9BACT